MRKILITGSNGFLGQKFVQYFNDQSDVEVIATSRGFNRVDRFNRFIYEPLDITITSEVSAVIQKHLPDVIINTAAMARVDNCEEDKAECWKVNVDGARNLALEANKIDAFLIQLSTDFVFDGLKGPYAENDEPNPVNFYGVSKLESETIIKSLANKWAIVRTILVYGQPLTGDKSNIVLWAKQNLEKNKPIRVVMDQFRMPTYVMDLARACGKIGFEEKEGLFHISGNNSMSILEIVYGVADYFKLDKSRITPVLSSDLNEKGKRPSNTGFNIHKAFIELDFRPHSLEEGLVLMSLVADK